MIHLTTSTLYKISEEDSVLLHALHHYLSNITTIASIPKLKYWFGLKRDGYFYIMTTMDTGSEIQTGFVKYELGDPFQEHNLKYEGGRGGPTEVLGISQKSPLQLSRRSFVARINCDLKRRFDFNDYKKIEKYDLILP